MQVADRLGHVTEYYFSQKLREIAQLRSQGKPIINLAIGSPDLPPHPRVIEALQLNSAKSDVHQYQSYQGIPELREAICTFYDSKFGVKLDPTEEILPLMGSKEGIMHISMAYLNKGDKVLIPELGYPTYSSVSRLLEADPIYYPLLENHNWEPDWSFFDRLNFDKVKIIWINYPHMPTGAPGSKELLEKFVRLAQEKNVLLINDNPYSFILNENHLSVFQIAGANEVALELNSMSKTFNMAGWRIGWVGGSKELIEPVLRVKSNMDSGMFKPLQLAAIEALSLDDNWYEKINGVYSERRAKAVQLLRKMKCTVSKNQVGLFLWGRFSDGNLDKLVDELLYEKSIFITPGHIFGSKGQQYLRVSLCSPQDRFDEAISRL